MKRLTDTFLLSNQNGECDIIAAGMDPVFGQVTPDKWTAYSTIKFGKSLPHVVGPESLSGKVFGIHPAVVARSFSTIIHKQMNLGHQLKSLGAKRDRICGCVLQCAFPEEPDGGWLVPASVGDAPVITAFAALFKQAEGVSDMLGKHLGGKVKMAVSMEFTYFHDEVGIFDPATGISYDRKDIPANLSGYLFEDEKGRLFVRKSARKHPLVLALGGVSGSVWFTGVGYTDHPADPLAEIESIAASRRGEGMMVCGETLEDLPLFAPGMPVKWEGGLYGRGTVAAVHLEGTHTLHRKLLTATPEDPALVIRLPDGSCILRRSSSVVKKFNFPD